MDSRWGGGAKEIYYSVSAVIILLINKDSRYIVTKIVGNFYLYECKANSFNS